MRSERWLVVAFFLIFGLTAFCYAPGLGGGFLFDDYPNLDDLGVYGGVVDWESFKSFVNNGFAGPTGRPLALATFLLDDNAWPSDPYSFKVTNLWIHLLCGVLIFASTRKLLSFYGKTSPHLEWIALLSSGIWLLHPYFVSTTLYIVQRMAQLSTLFVMLGLLGYLTGRCWLQRSPRKSYLLMSASIFLCSGLAALSKENGALLPLFIIVVEFCRPNIESKDRPNRYWMCIFLYIPGLLILGYLASMLDFSNAKWLNRNFSQYERLLTESRVLWGYMYDLWVPKIEGKGLFQDGYLLSRSMVSPPITLVAIISWLAAIVLAIFFRRRFPLVSLAILFFLIAHLVESTVINLEIHFEHRNYQASVFMFLPLASATISLLGVTRLRVLLVLICALLLMLSALTYQRSSLWSSSRDLELYWAASSSDSARAQSVIASALASAGKSDDAEQHLQESMKRLPESALLTMTWMLQRVRSGSVTEGDFVIAGKRLARQPFDAQAITGLRQLTEVVISQSASRDIEGMLSLIELLELSEIYGSQPLFLRLVPYLKGKLLLKSGRTGSAYACYRDAMQLYHDSDAAMMMVAEMSVHPGYALVLLSQARQVLKDQSTNSLKRSRFIYYSDMNRVEAALLSDAKKTGDTVESLKGMDNLRCDK